MTTTETIKYVGRVGFVNSNGLKFEVVVKDVQEAWGRLRFLISPTRGHGETWVESIQFPKDEVTK